MNRKLLFAFHGWLGLTLGLPLFLVCFSGTVAVMSPEIDRLIEPAMRVEPPAVDAEPRSWGELVSRIEDKYPSATVHGLRAGANRRSAYQGSISFSPSDRRLVFVDPYSGRVQGQGSPFNVKSFFRIFHKQFYILRSDYWPHGRVIVCSFALALLLSAATGLLFYKRWWRSLFRLRVGRGRRLFWSDLHRLVGVWSLLFAVLFGVTGSWYLAAQVLDDLDLRKTDFFAQIPPDILAGRPRLMEPVGLDALIAEAEEAYPDFDVQGVSMNSRPGVGVTVIGEGPAVLETGSANRVQLDPYTGETLGVEKAHELPLGPRLVASVDPLHFGRFGGVVTKVLWTLAGLALSVGILAGVYLWWLRAMGGEAGGLGRRRGWSAFSLLLNLAILLLAIASSILFINAQLAGPRQSVPGVYLGERSVDAWRVRAFRHGDRFRFRFVSDGDPNFRIATAWTGSEPSLESREPLRRMTDSLHSGPMENAAGDMVHLEIETWEGGARSVTFPTDPEGGRRMAAPEAPTVPVGVWGVVGSFCVLAGLPTVAWLVRIR